MVERQRRALDVRKETEARFCKTHQVTLKNLVFILRNHWSKGTGDRTHNSMHSLSCCVMIRLWGPR